MERRGKWFSSTTRSYIHPFIIHPFMYSSVTRLRKDGEERKVIQFHYTEWPCHSNPFSNALLEFRRKLIKSIKNDAIDNIQVSDPDPRILVGSRSGVFPIGRILILFQFDHPYSGSVPVFSWGSNTDPADFIPPDLELCSFYSGRVPSPSSRQACNPKAVVYVQNVLTHLIL